MNQHNKHNPNKNEPLHIHLGDDEDEHDDEGYEAIEVHDDDEVYDDGELHDDDGVEVIRPQGRRLITPLPAGAACATSQW